MKKTIKYISLILAILFVITGTVMVASATGDGGEGSGGEIVDPVDPAPADPDPVDDPVDPEPVDPEPVDPGPDEEPVDTDEPVSDNEPADGGSSAPQYVEEDPIWYGDASSRDYNTGNNEQSAGSVKDSTTLFNTSRTNNDDVKPNAWSDITLDEKTVPNKNTAGSFSAIKANTDKNDNGQWILYLGYLLIALSVIGIIYFIVATVSARKQNRREKRHSADTSASTARYTDVRVDNSSRKTTGHYADGYEAKTTRRSSKADTGEVYVPRRAIK